MYIFITDVYNIYGTTEIHEFYNIQKIFKI